VNDFIKDDLNPDGDGQVASGFVSLPDPVTQEQTFEREQIQLLVSLQSSIRQKRFAGLKN
jgi:hypothetical protein